MRRLLDLIALGVVIVLLLGAVLHLNHERRREEAENPGAGVGDAVGRQVKGVGIAFLGRR